MPRETIPKKKGVQIVKKRFKELLKSFGFQPYKNSTIKFVRVRDAFLDVVFLDTSGYHLDMRYLLYSRSAPFAWLGCDSGRLWRTAKEEISTHLFWGCKLTPSASAYYYVDDFETTWRDVSYAFEHYVLPQMDAMTEEKFCSRLLADSCDDRDFFRAEHLISFTREWFPGSESAAVYAVVLWRLGRYEESIPYLTFAHQKYREWVAERMQDASQYARSCRSILELLDDLLSLWNGQEEGWMLQGQARIDQVAADWAEYIP